MNETTHTFHSLAERGGIEIDSPIMIYEAIKFEWRSHDDNTDAGYLTVEYRRSNGGSSEFSGVIHPSPDEFCEGNPCNYCGHVWVIEPGVSDGQ